MQVGVVTVRITTSQGHKLAGEDEDPEEHEGKENLDLRKCCAHEWLEQTELFEHFEVEQEFLRCVHYQGEAQKSQRILNPVLLVIWHLQPRILNTKRKVEWVGEEAHQIDPVHEARKIGATLNPELFNFKSHQQKGGEHAKSVAHKDHWLYE